MINTNTNTNQENEMQSALEEQRDIQRVELNRIAFNFKNAQIDADRDGFLRIDPVNVKEIDYFLSHHPQLVADAINWRWEKNNLVTKCQHVRDLAQAYLLGRLSKNIDCVAPPDNNYVAMLRDRCPPRNDDFHMRVEADAVIDIYWFLSYYYRGYQRYRWENAEFNNLVTKTKETCNLVRAYLLGRDKRLAGN